MVWVVMMSVTSAGQRRPFSAPSVALLTTALLSFQIISQSLAMTPARAEDCPGHPNALGTSRTLVVDPTEHTRVGGMQYNETLPLQDHEVVLTFDDGPLPSHSNQVLETLAAECVKATFFIIGRMAHEYPDGVRRVRDAGHTVGTHSEDHPLTFNQMPIERAMQEINDGIEHTAAALGDPAAVAPFFRIPGLKRAEGVEEYLASKGIMTWSADFPADDWRHISSSQVLHLALTRLEAKGKGILLLHDIQARTAAMLPTLLRELKARGYRIVHVVPASVNQPKTPTEPKQWLLRPESVPMAGWPAVPHFVFAEAAMMPTPGLTSTETEYAGETANLHRGTPIFRPNRFAADTVPLPAEPLWPNPNLNVITQADELPAPDKSIFHMLEIGSVIKLSMRAQHALMLPAKTNAGDITGSIHALTGGRRQLSGSWPIPSGELQRGPLKPH
jgi:peptidoglycan/xylan/chitin deacetylase (PgdA/CDA1 family)